LHTLSSNCYVLCTRLLDSFHFHESFAQLLVLLDLITFSCLWCVCRSSQHLWRKPVKGAKRRKYRRVTGTILTIWRMEEGIFFQDNKYPTQWFCSLRPYESNEPKHGLIEVCMRKWRPNYCVHQSLTMRVIVLMTVTDDVRWSSVWCTTMVRAASVATIPSATPALHQHWLPPCMAGRKILCSPCLHNIIKTINTLSTNKTKLQSLSWW
jgi:hypothetical protein